MNELKLSDSLPVIETEIRQFQNLAGESIFEIGRRLKHVKENDLAHGEFGKWLESININHRVANRMMKVASTPELNSTTSSNLGMNVLYEIATLPEPERTKEHVTSKGEVKTPDEMTVKELRELKKQLKQRDELIASREQENEILQSKLEDAENREPETKVIEKEVVKEVVPEHIEQQLQEFKRKYEQETQSSSSLRAELDKYMEAFSDPNKAYDEKREKQLERESNINAYKLSIAIQKFIESNAVETYKVSSVIKSNEAAKKRLEENIELLEDFTTNIKSLINGRIITN